MFSTFYTTKRGQKYIAESMEEGKSLVLTKGQYGNGPLPDGVDIEEMGSLLSPLSDMQISKQEAIDNCLITTTQFTNMVNGTLLSPFHLMEIGLFGKIVNADGSDDANFPETLLFYANDLTKEKADYIPGTLTEFLINWPLMVNGTENITVEISDSLVYVTKDDLYATIGINVTAQGTGDIIIINVEEIETLNDGQILMIELTQDILENASIVYNGGDPLPIYNPNKTRITDGQYVAGSILFVGYRASDNCWYVIGGGAVAVASEEEALAAEDDTKIMTPYKVGLVIADVLGDVGAILDELNGEYEENSLADIAKTLDELNGKVI